MQTFVIGDLHLGDVAGRDVLRRPNALRLLCERLDNVDRLVLLGDVLELRHGALRARLDDAEPILRAIAAVMRGGAVTLLLGNHDRTLADAWLQERRLEDSQSASLGLDDRVPPDRCALTRHVSQWFAGTEFEIRYPGVWLDSGVYATHGHYMDVHIGTPTLERLAAGALGRLVSPLPIRAAAVDYEARLSPTFALYFEAAQSIGGDALGISAIESSLFELLERLPRVRSRSPALTTDVSAAGQIREALSAIKEAMARLAVGAEHVIFGHVHHSGPWSPDVAWRADHVQFWNPGSWVEDDEVIDAGDPRCPWRPGAAVLLDHGRPRLERILDAPY